MPNHTQEGPNGFSSFELHEHLMRGIAAAGFDEPRPIQREAMPACLDGQDVLGLAQTGTGKTAAFALPLLQYLLEEPGNGPRALILAPTRELATQIAEEIRTLAKFTRIKLVTIYGGVSARNQIEALRGRPEIVVGCPGRVLDLIQQKALNLRDVETLVLDEADHMFDMGFLPDIRRILSALPKERQNLLFSATMPKEIRHLANEVLFEPHVVELADTMPASTIDHALCHIGEKQKQPLLEHILHADNCTSAIVFTRTKHRARRLAQQLVKLGHNAVALQGNMSQAQRDRAMKGFRSGQFNILVATDIVARGIDVSGVSHVINYDVPNTPEAYTHRIGRTGRAEREGVAYTFVTSDDRAWVRATERKLGQPIARQEFSGVRSESAQTPDDGVTTKAAPASRPANDSRSDSRPPRRRNRRGNGSANGPNGNKGARPGNRPRGPSGEANGNVADGNRATSSAQPRARSGNTNGNTQEARTDRPNRPSRNGNTGSNANSNSRSSSRSRSNSGSGANRGRRASGNSSAASR